MVFDLPPLGAGARTRTGDAVALFIDRATMTSPTYALTEANSEAVRDICARLGGLPLAIELVASWIRVLSPLTSWLRSAKGLTRAQLRPTLRSRSGTAASTRYSTAPGGGSAAEDRRVLRGLGVFRGGFDRAAAESVAGATLASLSVLADHALIQRMPDSTGGSRYHLHELVRDYAVERLSTCRPKPSRRSALGTSTTSSAWWSRRMPTGRPVTSSRPWSLSSADQTDVEAALAWAIEARDTNRALRMTAGLFAFWVYTAKLGRIAAMFARVVDLPWDSSSTTAIRDRGRALHAAGWDALLAQDVDLADRRFQEGLALSEQVADSESAAANLRAIASVRRTSGDVVGDGHYLERALALSRTAGDERGTAWARNDLAGVAYSRGGVEEAIALVEEAVGSFERLGMGFGAYQAQVHLGELRLQVGQPALALDCFGRASAIQEGQHFVGHGSELFEGVAEVAAGMHRFEAGGHTARCRRLLAADLRAPARGFTPIERHLGIRRNPASARSGGVHQGVRGRSAAALGPQPRSAQDDHSRADCRARRIAGRADLARGRGASTRGFGVEQRRDRRPSGRQHPHGARAPAGTARRQLTDRLPTLRVPSTGPSSQNG